ncbi:MAG TPA: hypothetical protein VIL37_17775 [Natronosporangium sp.]
MSGRYPMRRWLLWAPPGLLLLVAVGLFGYGRFGGTTPDEADPYRWRPPAPLVISHHAGLTDVSWCQVRPDAGEPRTFQSRHWGSGSLTVDVERAWFDGEAEVICERAKLLTSPMGPYVDLWFPAAMLALVVAAVSAPVERRLRHRQLAPAAALPAPEPAAPAPASSSEGSATLVVDAHTIRAGRGLLAGLSRPRIVIDGHEHVGGWGRTELSIQPGRHHVEVWVPGLFPRRGGRADAEVEVAAGERTEIEFRAPLWRFLAGSLGPPPQHHRGAWLTFLIVGVAAVALCAVLTWAGLTGG